MLKAFGLTLSFLLIGGIYGLQTIRTTSSHNYNSYIERVIDGDTVVLRSGIHVRLIGIDAPESNSYRYGHPECYGKQSSIFLKRLSTGRKVWITTDNKMDIYGRLLAYVGLDRPKSKSLDLGMALLRRGYAKLYRFRGQRFSRLGIYRSAEIWAKRHERGLWRFCA